MNRKIPYHELAALLAGHCNITPAEAENFIKSFFDQLTRSLTEGETVKIKGIGTFAPTGDAEIPVSFIPDSEIADTINAPFAMFEPEEVSDSLSDDAFSQLDATEESDSEKPEGEELATLEVSAPQEEQDSQVATPASAEPIAEEEQLAVTEASQSLTEQPSTTETEHIAESTPAEEVATKTVAEPVSEQEHADEPAKNMHPTSEPTVEPVVTTPQATKPTPSVQPEPKTDAATPAVPVKPTTQPTQAKPTAKPIAPVAPVVTPKATPAFPDEEPEEYYREPEQKSGAGFGWGFVIGMLVGVALGACGVYFAIDYIFPTMPQTQRNNIEEAELVQEIQLDSVATPLADDSIKASTAPVATAVDTLKPAETQASSPSQAEPMVKDTVRPGYLLNDMAKKHYGNKCFWVYIYEENKAKIANPNRVGPGLVLVIPPAEKYGINPSSQASIKAANEKAGKILTKYPK